MVTLIIRNISEETYRLLKARAKRNGRSLVAEVRAILDASVAGAAAGIHVVDSPRSAAPKRA